MKKIFILLVTVTTLYSCKNDSKTETVDTENIELTLLTGDFVYYADAAVLQTPTEVYGVVINEKMHELDNQVKSYKQTDTDMVPVEIKGKIIPKPEGEEGWPFRIEIKEIINVSKPNPNKKDIIIGTEE
jgi:hypothetical protein